MLSYIYLDPPRDAFTIPIIDHPIVWYSLFFAAGFFLGYLIVAKLLLATPQPKKQTFAFLDKLAWYIFIGMIVGARLGHVFFYDWPHFQQHPLKILFTWEGGLSSHGAAVGLLLGLIIFWHNPKRRLPELSFTKLIDLLCIAACLVAGFIRVGNFFNQEILGTPSNLPFAVWFGHPSDAGAVMPCHPVQLYEAIFYFATFLLLYLLYPRLKVGVASGLFFLLIFTFRFFIEFLKLPQGYADTHFLSMGQLLSLPFILLGLYLLIKKNRSFNFHLL